MTIAVDWDVEHQFKQKKSVIINEFPTSLNFDILKRSDEHFVVRNKIVTEFLTFEFRIFVM